MSVTSTDRIEKSVVLRAPRARVWQALADAKAFGQWFGVDMAGPFEVGARVPGKVTHEGYEHLRFEVTVERMEPERLLAWRWHPDATDPDADYSAEPTTLVVFALEETVDGVMLTVTESGFDQIPLVRRAKAFTANEQGWGMVVKLIEKYLVHAP